MNDLLDEAGGEQAMEEEQDRFVTQVREKLEALGPEQRAELVATLQKKARQQDVNFPGLHEEQALEHPATLAGLLGHMRLNQPGVLEQLLEGTPFAEQLIN